jgi:hypothetical protein
MDKEIKTMDMRALAQWIEAKICGPCNQGYTCEDFDCEQARKISELLNKLEEFEGTDKNGQEVKGWLARS